MGEETRRGRDWPSWAKWMVSAVVGFHLLAIGAAAVSVPPASMLEQAVSGGFARYYELIDQGYSYRYYAPEPPPTPVVEARLRFADGRPERTIRLPDRSTRPRMRYQRELALANHLYAEHAQSRMMPPEARRPSHWGASYARHLGRVHGCQEVEIRATLHLVPNLGRVREQLADPDAAPVDLDAEEFYQVPDLIGVFPCDAS